MERPRAAKMSTGWPYFKVNKGDPFLKKPLQIRTFKEELIKIYTKDGKKGKPTK